MKAASSITELLKVLTLNFVGSYSVKVSDVTDLGVPVYVHSEVFKFLQILYVVDPRILIDHTAQI